MLFRCRGPRLDPDRRTSRRGFIMTSDRISFAGANRQLFSNPWPAVVLGVALTAAAAVWFSIFDHAAPWLVFAGLLVSGVAINIRPRPLIFGLAALSGLLGWVGLSW